MVKKQRHSEIDGLRSNAPGADPEDPYADVDVDDLPEWWRRAVREFEDYGLRPYRPPRFDDGTQTHEVVPDLEEEFGVSISFRSVGGDHREEWGVYVDGVRVLGVDKHRSTSGYTVYELSAERFETLVRDAVGAAGA
ncbi:MAG: hypothetical protein V5A44_12255 [Haloarculaceae archaeon]